MMRRLWATIAFTWLGIAVPAAWAAQAEPAPIAVRRVYAPADRLTEWPLGTERYLPLEAAEFERLLAAARASATGPDAALAVRLTAAEYRARLEGEQLVDGQAELQVESTAPAGGLLPWGGTDLALTQPAWIAPQPAPAVLGLAPASPAALVVERSGKLTARWSLRGRADDDGSIQFSLQLPPCAASRLVLDLPDTAVCTPDRGILTRRGKAGPGWTRWQIDLGGRSRVRLAISPAGGPAPGTRIEVRQTSVYDFSLHGVDVAVQLGLEIPTQPLKRLVVTLDRGLELLSARHGDRALEWAVMPGDANRGLRVELAFSEPVQGSQVIRLNALAPLSLDRPWRLPRVRAEGVYWRQGSVSLLLPQPLVLNRLVCDGWRQSGVGPLSAPRQGEALQMECFTPDGTAEVLLVHRPARMQVTSGLSLELGGDEIKAQFVAELSASDGDVFGVMADIGRNWIINAVECTPAESLQDWSAGKTRLSLTLAKALTPTRPLRVRVSARRFYAPPGRALSMAEMTPLHFPGATRARSLVGLRVSGPFDLKLASADALVRLDPRHLDAKDQQWLTGAAPEMVFVDDAGAAGLSAALQRRRPAYHATIAVEATLSGKLLEESYWVRCVPQSARVERLLVYFSARREAPVQWKLGSQGEAALDARRWSAEELTAAGLGSSEEAWELVLHRPSAEPFVIHGTRRSPLDGQQGLSLAALPEASTQQGSLAVRSTGPQDLRIKNQYLAPIPFAGSGGRKSPPVRASFRYDPARHVSGLSQPAVLVGYAERPSLAPVWVWDCRLQSRYQADGAALHLAEYQLQNQGATRLCLTLPAGIANEQIRGVWLDATPVNWHYSPAEPCVQVDLPTERLISLVVQFTTAAAPLGWRGTLNPPLPRAEVPVLRRHWIVWLPPGFDAARTTRSPTAHDGAIERLFGPLARGAVASPWHPLSDWRLPLDRAGQPTRSNAEQVASQFFQALETTLDQTAGEVSWEKLLRAGAAATKLPLLIDRRGLALAGVGPLTAVRRVAGADRLSRVASLLATAQLTLLVHDRALVLTSQTAAAMHRTELRPLHPWPVWWVPPGPLAERIQAAAAGQARDGLVALEAWSPTPDLQAAHWRLPALVGDNAADGYGWTAYWAEIPTDGRLELPYVHGTQMQLAAWVTLFTLFGVASLLVSRPALLTMAAGLLGGTALVVPVGWLPLVSAAFLALVVCLLWNWLRRARQPVTDEDSSPSTEVRSTASAPALGMLLVATWLATQSTATAAEPEQQAPTAKPPATHYDVFIPTDDRGQPTGGKYLLPEGLYNQLHRQAAAAQPAPPWMITAAEYRASLAWQAGPEGMGVERIKAVFQLSVFEPRARVRIPLSQAAAELIEAETLLDGRPVRCQWDLDGGGLLVDVAGPGVCRVQLGLRPAVKTVGAQVGFDLPIPALAQARLDLAVPADAPRFEFPSASGAISWSEEGCRWLVDLGPSSRLAVFWPSGVRRASGGNKIDVEELLWLKVQPNAVLIDTRFKYKVVEGQLRQLEIACDPRLRLLPPRNGGLTVTEAQATPGQVQRIRLDLARPVTDQFVFEGTLLLTGTAPVGNLRLPLLESVGARRTKRWLALSVDSALSYEERMPEPLETVSIPDFLAAWGGEAAPQLAYKLPTRTLWGIALRPRRPQTVADQVLRISYGPSGADMQFDAELNTTGGYCLQYRIAAPAGLEIDRISLLEDGVERVARWAADSDGSVWVFLSAPLAGKHVLSLRGRLATPARGAVPLPQLQMLQSQIASSTIEVFRRAAVHLRVAPQAGLVELQSPAAEMAKNEWGRLFRAYVADGKRRPAAMIHLSPNEPQVRAVETIALAETCDGWRAVAEFLLDVKQGSLERIELEVPAPATGPYTLDPPLPFRIVEHTGQAPQLMIDPVEPIRGVYRLRIACPVTASPTVRVPDLRLRTGTTAERRLVLPTRRQAATLAWETIGLRPIELPPALTNTGLLDHVDAPNAYRVQSEPFRAALRAQQEGTIGGEVRQAEITLALNRDGVCDGVAAFDLIPGSLLECPLTLPADCHLVQVYVAGQPVTPEARPGNRWQVPLLLGRLPQRVEVLFTGSVPTDRRPTAVVVPQLDDLRVRQTVWRVYAPPGTRFPRRELLHPLRAELLGLRNALALATIDVETSEAEPEELYCWHRLCLAQLTRRRVLVEAQLTEALWAGRDTSEPPTAIRAELKTAKAAAARIERWLAAHATLAPATQDAGLAVGLQSLWSATADLGESPVCMIGEGWIERLDVDLAKPGQLGWKNLFDGVLVCLLSMGVAALLQLPGLGRLVGQLGYLLVALVGVWWWFFLWPGFVGALLATGSLMLWIAQRWQQARAVPEAATISVHARVPRR
jgi:hypothetical protein